MRRRVEGVEEPRVRSDGRGDAEGEVLGELEGLEVVEDERLGKRASQMAEGAGEEKQRMAPEARGEARDGGRGTAERACELAMSGAGDEAGGDGDEKLGALEEVPGGEGLAREGAAAVQAQVARDAAAQAGPVEAVEAEAVQARAREAVSGTGLVRAEGRPEGLQPMDGCGWPVHGPQIAGSVPEGGGR